MDYDEFVQQKLSRVPATGLPHTPDLGGGPRPLFQFQQDLTGWCLRRGRCALFADTGLGKSAMTLTWAKHVAEYTGGRVLMLAPLAVGAQTVREGEKIGIAVKQLRYGVDVAETEERIIITNYDRLHHFFPEEFTGIVLDESSVIKNHDAKTFARLTECFRTTAFKLCASATPSPNDYTELGTHAEFLGVCSRTEMLAEFFCHDGGDTSNWRLKGHARAAFWKWISTWAALVRKPSDLGYLNEGYDLPPLVMVHHTIATDPSKAKEQGLLFAAPASTLTERRGARKDSMVDRVAQCAAVVAAEPTEPWIVWCELNAESDALAAAMVGAVEIRGNHDAMVKERNLVAFGEGQIRILVTKASMTGHGLNWQHAARMAFVGVSDSFEQTYQAIRRCYRFGQKREVHVHFFASELEGEVVKNLRRKESEAAAMGEVLSAETRDAVRAEIGGTKRVTNEWNPSVKGSIPSWLTGSQ